MSFNKKLVYLAFLILCTACSKKTTAVIIDPDLKTPFEKDNNYSASYEQVVEYYERLAFDHPEIQANRVGETDSGHPLHEVIVSGDYDFNPGSIRAKGKAVMFVNNAIHPGEPCGVDASMMLVRDLLAPANRHLLEHTVVVLIPFYNISGGLNRGSYSRANQKGPRLYGFRGNAKNLDLNRDFIKCDTKNARTFSQVYTKWDPDVFVDNHTSNGADYQYVMTLIPTQKEKLAPELSRLMTRDMLPFLFDQMKGRKYELTPYVYVNNTPDDGIAGFLDLPRYSSGYAALHNAISFMPESHMLKDYKDRVYGTYQFSLSMLTYLEKEYTKVIATRDKAKAQQKKQKTFDVNWAVDLDKVEDLEFKGYKAMYKPSAVSGEDRLYYDHNQPYQKKVPFYNSYKSTLSVDKPKAYIIPQAYSKVIDRLKLNKVDMTQLTEDEILEVSMYYIEDYETKKYPYESHYLHSDVKVKEVKQKRKYFKGDYRIEMDQDKARFIIETLEPQGPDSYFAWNFFDGILMQKEHFSSYVFEDTAARMLEEDKDLQKRFAAKKKKDSDFANNARAQLNWIYEQSRHYEKTFKLYPVGRIL